MPIPVTDTNIEIQTNSKKTTSTMDMNTAAVMSKSVNDARGAFPASLIDSASARNWRSIYKTPDTIADHFTTQTEPLLGTLNKASLQPSMIPTLG